jgi:hypothetical protein
MNIEEYRQRHELAVERIRGARDIQIRGTATTTPTRGRHRAREPLQRVAVDEAEKQARLASRRTDRSRPAAVSC